MYLGKCENYDKNMDIQVGSLKFTTDTTGGEPAAFVYSAPFVCHDAKQAILLKVVHILVARAHLFWSAVFYKFFICETNNCLKKHLKISPEP